MSKVMDRAVQTQETTNILLGELLRNVKKSNKILMAVNAVNIMTIIVLLVFIIGG
jgi:hypothetical protein